MATTYPEQLAQWIAQRELAPSDRNRVAFMAVHDDVKTAIEAGYAVKTVWEHLRETGRISLSYKTFLNYVRRVIGPMPRPGQAMHAKPACVPAPVAGTPDGGGPTPVRVLPLPAPGFSYDPVPNKEELL